MKLPSLPVAVVSALVLFIVAGGAFLLLRPVEDTCFARLGGPGPNSNTSRFETWLDLPADQWPAVAGVMREFAAAHGWLISGGPGASDPTMNWLDMCDHVTIVRASSRYGVGDGIGFGIIHMNYEGPGNDGWRPLYRDLHRRLEARWPGRMRYMEGEFRQPMARPDWLGAPPAPAGNSVQ